MMRYFCVTTILSLCFCVFAEPVSLNLFPGGDFEQPGRSDYGAGLFRTAEGKGKTIHQRKRADAASGQSFLEFKLDNNSHLFKKRVILLGTGKYAGRCYRLSAKVRGNGYFSAELHGTINMQTTCSASSPEKLLTENWEEYSAVFDFSSCAPDRLLLQFNFKGAGSRFDIDDVKLECDYNPDFKISVTDGALVIAENTRFPDQIFSVAPSINGNGSFIFVNQKRIGKKLPVIIKDGKAVFPGKELSAGIYRVGLVFNGASAFRDLVVVPEKNWKILRDAAAGVRVRKTLSILMLGDSITDWNRMSNWLYLAIGCLNEQGHKITLTNAACGGDQVQRILARLKNGESVYRSSMYQGMFDRKYDLILFFTGQNDTVSFERDGYKKPQLSPDTVESCLRQIIVHLKQQTSAPMILFSGLCISQDIWDKQASQTHYRFGIPQFVEDYNRVVQKLGKEFGFCYFDLYHPMSSLPEKELQSFYSDGVHLSKKGHLFVAEQFLKFFAAYNRQE